MRITKTVLESEEINQIKTIVNEVSPDNGDVTLAYDFAKDAYSLFKEEVSKRGIIKTYWDIFRDIKMQYSRFKMMNLMKNVEFYGRVRSFFKLFITSNLFYELSKLDPMEALEAFLKMFQPPQQQQQKPSPQSQPQQNDEDEDGQGDKQPGDGDDGQGSPSQQDQGGISADEGNMPIDMKEFKDNMPQIEKALDSGILDKDDLKEYLKHNAGVGSNEIQISNIKDLIKKISKKLSARELEIFYVARKKEVTEKYRRDEVLESVPYPEDEMSIKNIDTPMEILKTVPTQYAYDDDIFMQKLVKKELLIRDYQARRLKKQALYLLIDVSGSMGGMRNVYACGVALAFMRQAVDEGSTYYLRFFDDRPHGLEMVTNQEEAKKMYNRLLRQPFSGGGTSISRAIEVAVDDITKAPEKFEKAEIMLISDGEDSVYLSKDSLRGIKLHSTIIENQNNTLKLISETYLELRGKDLE